MAIIIKLLSPRQPGLLDVPYFPPHPSPLPQGEREYLAGNSKSSVALRPALTDSLP